MKEKHSRSAKNSVPTMTASQALEAMKNYPGGVIAWKKDRSGVYALAQTDDELCQKLSNLGITLDQVIIDSLLFRYNTTEYGFKYDD